MKLHRLVSVVVWFHLSLQQGFRFGVFRASLVPDAPLGGGMVISA